ncbi:MAG: TolB family protein [Gemmatimonadota bacterium]
MPVSGGEPTVLANDVPPQFPFMLGPGGETYVASERTGPRAQVLSVKAVNGSVLKTITTNRNTRPLQFTADGRGIVLIEANTIAPTRIVSIAGGAYRDITSPKDYYDWVLGWSADGSAVYTWTEPNGEPALARVPVTGGEKASELRVFRCATC